MAISREVLTGNFIPAIGYFLSREKTLKAERQTGLEPATLSLGS